MKKRAVVVMGLAVCFHFFGIAERDSLKVMFLIYIYIERQLKGFFKDDQGKWVGEKLPDTGIALSKLERIAECVSTSPKDITLHGGLKRVLKARAKMSEEKTADWSMGESFGWGSLLMDGNHVRVSGQDVERGTFSHRHHVLHCQKQDKKVHLPMSQLSPDQEIVNLIFSL